VYKLFRFFFFGCRNTFFLILLVFQEFSKLLLTNILANVGDGIFEEGFDSCVSQAVSWHAMHLNVM